MRCIVIRGDAWLVLLSPCNTLLQQLVNLALANAVYATGLTKTEQAQYRSCLILPTTAGIS